MNKKKKKTIRGVSYLLAPPAPLYRHVIFFTYTQSGARQRRSKRWDSGLVGSGKWTYTKSFSTAKNALNINRKCIMYGRDRRYNAFIIEKNDLKLF